MKQVKLSYNNIESIVWLDEIVKVGDGVTLKDSEYPKRIWKVIEIFNASIDKRNIKDGRDWFGTDYVKKSGSYLSKQWS
jgi:hypothetical protein